MLKTIGSINFNSNSYKIVEFSGVRLISDTQLAQVLQFSKGARYVRTVVKRNNLNPMCLKSRANSSATLYSFLIQELGYTVQSIALSNNIYFFDIDNLLYFLSAIEVRDITVSNFMQSYFNIDERDINFHCTLRKENGFGKMLEDVTKSITLFEKQYDIDNYRVDFYSKEFNLAVEYDEDRHKYRQDEDELRQKHIENKLGCHFIRVKEGQESIGLGEVVEYLFKFSFEKSGILNEA